MTYCCENVYQVLCSSKDLSILKSLVDLAGLKCEVQKLRCSTLFAPTNRALEETPAELVKYLTDPKNRSLLRSVLLYHIAPKAYTTQQLESSLVLTMLNKPNLTEGVSNKETVYRALYYDWVPVLHDAVQHNWDVVEGNIATKGGNYVHKINGLLQPEVIYYPKVINPRGEPGTY